MRHGALLDINYTAFQFGGGDDDLAMAVNDSIKRRAIAAAHRKKNRLGTPQTLSQQDATKFIDPLQSPANPSTTPIQPPLKEGTNSSVVLQTSDNNNNPNNSKDVAANSFSLTTAVDNSQESQLRKDLEGENGSGGADGTTVKSSMMSSQHPQLDANKSGSKRKIKIVKKKRSASSGPHNGSSNSKNASTTSLLAAVKPPPNEIGVIHSPKPPALMPFMLGGPPANMVLPMFGLPSPGSPNASSTSRGSSPRSHPSHVSKAYRDYYSNQATNSRGSSNNSRERSGHRRNNSDNHFYRSDGEDDDSDDSDDERNAFRNAVGDEDLEDIYGNIFGGVGGGFVQQSSPRANSNPSQHGGGGSGGSGRVGLPFSRAPSNGSNGGGSNNSSPRRYSSNLNRDDLQRGGDAESGEHTSPNRTRVLTTNKHSRHSSNGRTASNVGRSADTNKEDGSRERTSVGSTAREQHSSQANNTSPSTENKSEQSPVSVQDGDVRPEPHNVDAFQQDSGQTAEAEEDYRQAVLAFRRSQLLTELQAQYQAKLPFISAINAMTETLSVLQQHNQPQHELPGENATVAAAAATTAAPHLYQRMMLRAGCSSPDAMLAYFIQYLGPHPQYELYFQVDFIQIIRQSGQFSEANLEIFQQKELLRQRRIQVAEAAGIDIYDKKNNNNNSGGSGSTIPYVEGAETNRQLQEEIAAFVNANVMADTSIRKLLITDMVAWAMAKDIVTEAWATVNNQQQQQRGLVSPLSGLADPPTSGKSLNSFSSNQAHRSASPHKGSAYARALLTCANNSFGFLKTGKSYLNSTLRPKLLSLFTSQESLNLFYSDQREILFPSHANSNSDGQGDNRSGEDNEAQFLRQKAIHQPLLQQQAVEFINSITTKDLDLFRAVLLWELWIKIPVGDMKVCAQSIETTAPAAPAMERSTHGNSTISILPPASNLASAIQFLTYCNTTVIAAPHSVADHDESAQLFAGIDKHVASKALTLFAATTASVPQSSQSLEPVVSIQPLKFTLGLRLFFLSDDCLQAMSTADLSDPTTTTISSSGGTLTSSAVVAAPFGATFVSSSQGEDASASATHNQSPKSQHFEVSQAPVAGIGAISPNRKQQFGNSNSTNARAHSLQQQEQQSGEPSLAASPPPEVGPISSIDPLSSAAEPQLQQRGTHTALQPNANYNHYPLGRLFTTLSATSSPPQSAAHATTIITTPLSSASDCYAAIVAHHAAQNAAASASAGELASRLGSSMVTSIERIKNAPSPLADLAPASQLSTADAAPQQAPPVTRSDRTTYHAEESDNHPDAIKSVTSEIARTAEVQNNEDQQQPQPASHLHPKGTYSHPTSPLGTTGGPTTFTTCPEDNSNSIASPSASSTTRNIALVASGQLTLEEIESLLLVSPNDVLVQSLSNSKSTNNKEGKTSIMSSTGPTSKLSADPTYDDSNYQIVDVQFMPLEEIEALIAQPNNTSSNNIKPPVISETRPGTASHNNSHTNDILEIVTAIESARSMDEKAKVTSNSATPQNLALVSGLDNHHQKAAQKAIENEVEGDKTLIKEETINDPTLGTTPGATATATATATAGGGVPRGEQSSNSYSSATMLANESATTVVIRIDKLEAAAAAAAEVTNSRKSSELDPIALQNATAATITTTAPALPLQQPQLMAVVPTLGEDNTSGGNRPPKAPRNGTGLRKDATTPRSVVHQVPSEEEHHRASIRMSSDSGADVGIRTMVAPLASRHDQSLTTPEPASIVGEQVAERPQQQRRRSSVMFSEDLATATVTSAPPTDSAPPKKEAIDPTQTLPHELPTETVSKHEPTSEPSGTVAPTSSCTTEATQVSNIIEPPPTKLVQQNDNDKGRHEVLVTADNVLPSQQPNLSRETQSAPEQQQQSTSHPAHSLTPLQIPMPPTSTPAHAEKAARAPLASSTPDLAPLALPSPRAQAAPTIPGAKTAIPTSPRRPVDQQSQGQRQQSSVPLTQLSPLATLSPRTTTTSGANGGKSPATIKKSPSSGVAVGHPLPLPQPSIPHLATISPRSSVVAPHASNNPQPTRETLHLNPNPPPLSSPRNRQASLDYNSNNHSSFFSTSSNNNSNPFGKSVNRSSASASQDSSGSPIAQLMHTSALTRPPPPGPPKPGGNLAISDEAKRVRAIADEAIRKRMLEKETAAAAELQPKNSGSYSNKASPLKRAGGGTGASSKAMLSPASSAVPQPSPLSLKAKHEVPSAVVQSTKSQPPQDINQITKGILYHQNHGNGAAMAPSTTGTEHDSSSQNPGLKSRVVNGIELPNFAAITSGTFLMSSGNGHDANKSHGNSTHSRSSSKDRSSNSQKNSNNGANKGSSSSILVPGGDQNSVLQISKNAYSSKVPSHPTGKRSITEGGPLSEKPAPIHVSIPNDFKLSPSSSSDK